MPEDAPKSSKKYLGLSPITWLLIAGGGIAAFVTYRKYESGVAASNANATSDGQTTPGNSTTSGAVSSGGSAPATLAEWAQAFISGATTASYSASQALNDYSAWLNGSCVSQAGYNAIGNAIVTLGTPPGYNGALPSLSVCANGGTSSGGSSSTTSGGGTGTTAAAPAANNTDVIPALASNIAAAMSANGEHIVSDFYDSATKTYIYVTNKGGVYTETSSGAPGGTFYGSYLGLPPQDTQTAAGVVRQFTSAYANADGTYTLVSNTKNPSTGQYETYTFGPGTPQNA